MMKAAIFAGGLGTRMGLTELPKPLVSVGGLPILVHIMSIYLANGLRDFVILGGYKYEILLNYFREKDFASSSTLDNGVIFNDMQINSSPLFSLIVLNTGHNTQTGGRLLRARKWLSEPFCLTYADSLVDFNLKDALETHQNNRAQVTVSTYCHPFPYGTLTLNGERVEEFSEKKVSPQISAGFFIVQPDVIDRISSDNCVFEVDILPQLAEEGVLYANSAINFWHPMDTPEHLASLERVIQEGKFPWFGNLASATVIT